jgi:hypothetical protein
MERQERRVTGEVLPEKLEEHSFADTAINGFVVSLGDSWG